MQRLLPLKDNAVRFEEPTWWYGRGDGLLARSLQPLASAYGSVTMRRMQRTGAYRSRLPVICVGNFTAGGTGKTPLTMRICELLAARGVAPVVLSRGYGGSMRGPHWVDAERDVAAAVGDEPLLFARRFATVVARDRAAGARMIEAAGEKASVIVMDDGMQNPGLAKDLAIAVVDARRGFGNGRVIPAGPLRAPLTFQFGMAHAIVVNAGSAADDLGGAVVGQLRQQFHGPVLEAQVKALADREQLTRRPLIAFAGIGAPQRFFESLVRAGGSVLAEHRFPDHHVFSAADAERLLKQARETGAQLITTEKDFARMSGATGAQLTLREQSATLPIAMVFDGTSEQRLLALIDAALSVRMQAAGLQR